MVSCRPLLLGLVALTSIPGCLAQAPAPPTRDARALAVVASALAASGPLSAIVDSVAIVRQGTTQTTVTSLGPDRMRADWNAGGAARGWVVNGGRRLHLAKDGVTWRSAPDANAPFIRRTLLPGPLLTDELARPEVSLAWVGDETADGAAAIHIRFSRVLAQHGDPAIAQSLAHAAQLDVWIADDSHLVVKLGWLQISADDIRRGEPVSITYGDYRATPGPAGSLQLPYAITSWVADAQVSTTTVESFQFNTGVAAALFTPGGGH